MQITISQPTIINEYDFKDDNFDFFHSICHIDGIDYTFTRNVTNHNWPNTRVRINGNDIGLGEDPRAFNLLGIPACYAVRFNETERFVPQIFLKSDDGWDCLKINTGSLPAGKNWGPFVYQDELYFVHETSPFRVLKLNGDAVSEVFKIDVPCENQCFDNYPILRSGSNGLEIDSGIIVGFGHDNYGLPGDIYSIKHKPFGWILDMNQQHVDIVDLEFDWDEKYMIVDAVSFVEKDGQHYLITCETETHQAKQKQTGRTCWYPVNID